MVRQILNRAAVHVWGLMSQSCEMFNPSTCFFQTISRGNIDTLRKQYFPKIFVENLREIETVWTSRSGD
jgi:hypothetical protein